LMAIIIPLFMWQDLIRMKHFFQKKMDIKRIRNSVGVLVAHIYRSLADFIS